VATPFPPKLKLHHHTPSWVPDGESFHIRIRVDRTQARSLIEPVLASALLDSVRFYHQRARWHCSLFLLMADHLHALLAFPPPSAMSRTVGDWKKYHTLKHRVAWQDGYFDHRIRDAKEFEEKATYVRHNPVVKGLCARPEDWPWIIDAHSLAPDLPP